VIRALIYLAMGAVAHLLLLGDQFNFQSVWTWVVLFGWPLVLLSALLIAGLVAFAVATTVIAVMGWAD